MKFAAAVLRNITISQSSVRYGEVVDALLSGGIILEEVILLPYDDPGRVLSSLERMKGEFDGIFLICDRVLLPVAREALSAAASRNFADGYVFRTENKLFSVLPTGKNGVKICREQAIPAVDSMRGQSFFSIVIRTVRAPSSKILSAVSRAEEEAEGKLSIELSEEYGVGRIEIVYRRDTPKVLTDEVVRILADALEEYIYAMEDVSPAERLFETLKLHRQRISTAESFTGGGVGSAIVAIPGASKVFYEGINAYDEKSKMRRLGVTDYTLKNKGAVSSETAFEMAEGLLKEGCDVAISTTGIAGPDTDLSGAPVGKCFIGVGVKDKIKVYEYNLSGDRETITKTAINLALFSAYKEIH